MKNRTPLWKEKMIDEIRRMNKFIEFLKTINTLNARRRPVRKLKIRYTTTAFPVSIRTVAS